MKRRVSEIEGSFGFLTQQLKSVHRDLLTFQTKAEQSFDTIDGRFGKVESRLDRLDTSVRKLREDMPEIVGDAMRAVQRGQNGKPRKR